MAIDFKLIYISIFIFMFSHQFVASNKIKILGPRSNKVIESDLPSHKDLDVYLTVLERIINFSSQNERILDINFLFGLFLVNVNLKPFVSDGAIPVSTRSRLMQLLTTIDKIREDYDSTLLKDPQTILASLSTNDTAWSSRISKLSLGSPSQSWYSYEYPEWNIYRRAVLDVHKGVPNPRQSDMCLASLAESVENLSEYSLHCKIPVNCYKALLFGTNFGYSLTHRLLLLLHARLSRACTIFSTHEDEFLRKTFCEMAYKEAEYNAINGFEIIDLIFEQTALCTLDGHAHFLRKSWLSTFLKYQTPMGCFKGNGLTFAHFFQWTDGPNEDFASNVICTPHVTAVAAATFAAAVRFVLENY